LIAALLSGIALTVSPAHAVMTAPASRTIDVLNTGTVNVGVAVRSASSRFLEIRPHRLTLGPRAHRLLTVRARAVARARAGDHELLVLLVARPLERSAVAVQMRIGVRLRVRMPGRLVRHIVVLGIRVNRTARPRLLLVNVANAGNMTERLRGRLTVRLVRRGRVISQLRYAGRRELVPGSHAVVPLPYRGGARGTLDGVVRIGSVKRRYRLRL
jgi:hypothetical protein